MNPDVIEYLPDFAAVREEGHQPHLPTAQRAQ
jgi:hypothetical protein